MSVFFSRKAFDTDAVLGLAQAQASYVAGFPVPLPLPPGRGIVRAHPSGWTRTQGLSHRDSHAPPLTGRPPSGCGTGRWLLFYDETETKLGDRFASVLHAASLVFLRSFESVTQP